MMILSNKEQACLDIAIKIREKHIQDKGYSEERANNYVPVPELNKVDGRFSTLWNQLRPGANQMYVSYSDEEVVVCAAGIVKVLFGDEKVFLLEYEKVMETYNSRFGNNENSKRVGNNRVYVTYAPGIPTFTESVVEDLIPEIYGDTYIP